MALPHSLDINITPTDQLQQQPVPNLHHKLLEGQLPSTPLSPPELVQWHALPTWVQTQPESLQHLEEPPGRASNLLAQQTAVVPSSPLSMQPVALQLLDIGQPTIQQPGHPRSQTTVAPFVINVSQPSATAHRHKGIKDFVIEGPASCSLSLKPSQELSSQQSLESLLEQEAFPESLTVIKKEHDSEEYSQPRMPLEVEPLIQQEFHLEQSELSPQDETNQQEIVDQSSGSGSEGIGRTHTELSKEMLLWQQAGMLTSGGKVEQAVHGDTQEMFTDLGSVLTACNTSSSKERQTSGHHSPERTLTTKFFSEMQSELAHIVTLMQVVLCLHANCSPPFAILYPLFSSFSSSTPSPSLLLPFFLLPPLPSFFLLLLPPPFSFSLFPLPFSPSSSLNKYRVPSPGGAMAEHHTALRAW